jgi:hypothetical protein
MRSPCRVPACALVSTVPNTVSRTPDVAARADLQAGAPSTRASTNPKATKNHAPATKPSVAAAYASCVKVVSDSARYLAASRAVVSRGGSSWVERPMTLAKSSTTKTRPMTPAVRASRTCGSVVVGESVTTSMALTTKVA